MDLRQYEANALSVSVFLQKTNSFMENWGDVLVVGEISQITMRNHWYFTIKDDNSAVSCVMFRSAAMRVNFIPETGQKVLVMGRASLYNKDGRFSIKVAEMALSGAGYIREALERLRQQLAAEGLFQRKRPLPRIMARVGVVTSTDGRVRDDIINNVMRRNPFVELVFFDTRVQGADAPVFLCRALQNAYNYAVAGLDPQLFMAGKVRPNLDVIIFGRGGGSFEDLLCFSDEQVVRMVACSPVPIISAVGHDEDRPLCDDAADLRVSTPTTAAETVTPITRTMMLDFLNQMVRYSHNLIARHLDERGMFIDRQIEHLERSSLPARLNYCHSLSQMLPQRLEHAMTRRLMQYRSYLEYQERMLYEQGVQVRLMQRQTRVMEALNRLEQVPQYLSRLQSRLNQIQSGLDAARQRLWQRMDQSYGRRLSQLCWRLEQVMTERMSTADSRCQQGSAFLSSYLKALESRQQQSSQLLDQWERRLDLALQQRVTQVHTRHLQLLQQLERLSERQEQQLKSAHQTLRLKYLPQLEQQMQQHLRQAQDRLAHNVKLTEDSISGARLTGHLDTLMAAHLKTITEHLERLNQALDRSYEQRISKDLNAAAVRMSALYSQLISLNPLYQLERGLSLTTTDRHHAVKGEDIRVGDELITILKDYEVTSTVTDITPKHPDALTLAVTSEAEVQSAVTPTTNDAPDAPVSVYLH